MKRLILNVAVTAAVALAAGRAWAGYGQRGYYAPHAPSSFYSHQHHHYPYHGYYWRPPVYRYHGSSFNEAAREVRAYHSRYRIHTHPRDLYKSPPRRYYWGW